MLAKIATSILVFIGASVFMGAMVIYQTGIVYVEVEEKKPDGHHLFIPVPVILAHAAVAFVPDKEMEEVRAEVGPRKELVLAACDALIACPDGPFVEYKNGVDEHVTVVKRGRYLYVDADTKDEKVKVRVPIHAVRNLVKQVAD
ncbi:MAG: hypothetical protein EHM61_17435 [Acidobacteria bacterium]|nr:MAG: hypothetical protein EHM61_17435 [Acidobacteriota bacterium]